MSIYYVMVDRPAIKFQGDRKIRHTNKPRREHRSLDSALSEAIRLSNKTKGRVLVLEVVKSVSYIEQTDVIQNH